MKANPVNVFLMGLVFVVKIEPASLRFALLQVDFGNKSAYCIIFYPYKCDKSKILLILQRITPIRVVKIDYSTTLKY